MSGKNHFALFPDVENEAIFRRVRDTGEPAIYKDRPFEFPDQPERGVTYWDWSLVPEKDSSDKVVGLVFTLRETTKQKQAEEALRESEARYRTLFTNMNEGFALGSVIYGEDGLPLDFCFLEVNDAFRQQTGLTRQILGRPMTEALPNLERYWIDTYSDVALTGKPVRFSNYNKDTNRHYDVFCYSPARGRFAILFRDVTKEKQAEDALKKALAEAEDGKRTLDTLMEYVPDGISIADAPDLNIRLVSRYGQELLGGPHHGMTAGEVSERWHVYDQDGATLIAEADLPLVRAIRKGETVRDKELVQVDAQGRRVTLLCNAAPIRSGTGHITGGIVAWRDITEMRKTRDALRESERLYRAIGESIDYGVWVCDPDGRNTYTSESFLKLVGMTQEQCSNFGWGDILHPDDAARTIAAWKECVRTGGHWDFEHRFRGVDGQWHSILARGVPVKNEKGEVLFWAGINLDISRLKSVEEALRKSEARFKLLSETAGKLLATDDPQGIVNELCQGVMAYLDCHSFFNFLVDEEAGRLHLNACAGIPEDEARKIEWLDYGVGVCGCVARDAVRIVAEDISHTSDPRTELVKSYGLQAYACHPLIAQGRLIGTLAFGTRTRARFSDEDLILMKTVADQVAMAMDRIGLIEGLRRSRDKLETRVQERTAELARSNRELQDFASIASHDLQEPLRKVQAFGNLLVERHSECLNDEGRDYLARMKSAAARMQGLIGSLLDYSRVTSRAKPFSEVDLNEAAKEALLNLEVRIKETGGRVEVDGLPFIMADRSQVVQLFQNLIGNGLKFHKEGDPPHVKVYATPGKGTKPGKRDFWEITVEDNGIGFDETKVDRIFEPFQRLHGRSSPYAGTGMGLAICRKIVERHGGTITAKSIVGKGAAFIITLPKK
jgi:PAS domain S-box-containing protein